MHDDSPSDEFSRWLDGELRATPLPAGLSHRLQQIAAPSNAELDAELCAVDLPAGFMLRLVREARQFSTAAPTFFHTRSGLALAASVAILATAGWFMGLASSVDGALERGELVSEADWLAVSELSPEVLSNPREGFVLDIIDNRHNHVWQEMISRERAGTAFIARQVGQQGFLTLLGLPFNEHFAQRPLAVSFTEPNLRDMALADGLLTPERWRDAALVDPLLQATLGELRHSRALESPTTVAPRWPLAPQADLALANADRSFLNRVGMYPPVLTTARPGVTLGLNSGSASYDAARQLAARRQLVEPDGVRTEEWLAALAALSAPTPVAPKPTNPTDKPPGVPAFALALSAGPSPFTGGQHLLHVGLGMRANPRAAHRPTHLVLVVDTTAPMTVAGRAELVRRGLEVLPKHLAPTDRLSLVRCGEQIDTLFTGAALGDLTGKGASLWQSALGQLQPTEATSTLINSPVASNAAAGTAAGVAVGLSIAREVRMPAGGMTRVVLLTPAVESGLELAWPMLQPLATPLGGKGTIALDVLPIRPVEPLVPSWRQMTAATSGLWGPCVHTAQLQGRLVESLTGRSQVVLQDARLSLAFSPDNVLSYRLLGHEPPRVPGVEGSQVDRHLYAGQAAGLLVEVRVASGKTLPPDAELATVTLQWRDARDGSWVKSSRRLLASQVKTTFEESPAAWQAASLVGAAAEVARRSPFAEQLSFAEITPRWRRLTVAAAHSAEFSEFLSLVEQLDLSTKKGAPPRQK